MVKLVSWPVSNLRNSRVQTFRCVRWCPWLKSVADNANKEFLVEPIRVRWLAKWRLKSSWQGWTPWEVEYGWFKQKYRGQKYINLNNLRVAKKNSLRESKIIQQKLTTDRDDPRCTLISKTKSLIVSNWSHLSNRGRFDWWIDLANPGLQPLSSRLL